MKRAALILGTAVLASSCATSPDGLRIEVVTSADTVSVDSPIEVTVKASNLGTRPITIQGNPCPPRFAVFDAAGEFVGPQAFFCFSISIPKEIGVGETGYFVHRWSGYGRGEDFRNPAPLPPGTYSLVGGVAVIDGGPVYQSEPVLVRVK